MFLAVTKSAWSAWPKSGQAVRYAVPAYRNALNRASAAALPTVKCREASMHGRGRGTCERFGLPPNGLQCTGAGGGLPSREWAQSGAARKARSRQSGTEVRMRRQGPLERDLEPPLGPVSGRYRR